MLTTAPHGAELDGEYATADGGRLTARVSGLSACVDGPSVALSLDTRHSFQVRTAGLRDAAEAVEAVRALLAAFAGGEVTASRAPGRRSPAALPARVRGC